MIVGVPQEQYKGERRVALIPHSVSMLRRADQAVIVEAGAGVAAGFSDDDYRAQGATVVDSREALYAQADVILRVRAAGAEPDQAAAERDLLRPGQTLIGMMEPLWDPEKMQQLATTGVDAYAMELIPRISRAQSMDVLSSMATIAGYKAILLAAATLPKIFPLMMTAAGTLTPARVLVVGAGVAGLQAIGTSRRLGALTEGYDIRPDVKEQVESLGAKFVELPLETSAAEGEGGYAQEQDEAFLRRQQELLAETVARSDVVVTTASIPGKPAPQIINADMVRGMALGSVIVDLAAERGGNCELTEADRTIQAHGVTIMGPTNLPATMPNHASQMYSRNLVTFLTHLLKQMESGEGDDEIVRETRVTLGGEVVNPRVRERLGETIPDRQVVS